MKYDPCIPKGYKKAINCARKELMNKEIMNYYSLNHSFTKTAFWMFSGIDRHKSLSPCYS